MTEEIIFWFVIGVVVALIVSGAIVLFGSTIQRKKDEQ
jgi:hypothetical protein